MREYQGKQNQALPTSKVEPPSPSPELPKASAGDGILSHQKILSSISTTHDQADGSPFQMMAMQAKDLQMPMFAMPMASLPIQRVTETATVAKSYDELMDMTISQLVKHANAQADWHAHVADAGERGRVRLLLGLIRNNEGAGGACRNWKASDLWAAIKTGDSSGLEATETAKILAYTRGVRHTTARCKPQADVADGLAFGQTILKLETKLDPAMLAHIFTEKMFGKLHTANKVDDFVTYYDTCKPHLAAEDGEEIKAYLALRAEGANPVAYNGTAIKDPIRNYHRFEKAALDKLVTNFGDTSKAKPLTLILHSQTDHNGAFFRDEKLTALITNPNLYVLMIEGKTDLASAQSDIDTYLGTHAQGGKIDQVMIAGHGEARSIDLTGEVDDHEEDNTEDIDLDEMDGKAFLDHIIDKLVDNASPNEAVVVFNACLTNSNAVDVDEVDLTGNVAEQALAIRDYIKDNPSLATYVAQKATAKGITVKAIGSSASTTSGGDFYDASHRLTLEDADDPKFTAPKIEYVEEGKEPLGALRAALETWAAVGGPGPALAKIDERAKKGDSTDWAEQLIRSLYARIMAQYQADAAGIARLVEIANDLAEYADDESEAVYKNLKSIAKGPFKDDVLYTIAKMTNTDDYKNEKHIPLALLQLAMFHSQDTKAAIIAKLGLFNLREATQYKYLDVTKMNLNTMLPDGDAAAPPKGQLLLGLMSIKQPRGRAFLLKHLEGRDDFPPGDHIADVLGGKRSETEVLVELGKMAAAAAPDVKGNVKLEGDASNKGYVKPLTKSGKINADDTKVKQKPDDVSADFATLGNNTAVFILGETPTHYAIEHGVKTGFVLKTAITLD